MKFRYKKGLAVFLFLALTISSIYGMASCGTNTDNHREIHMSEAIRPSIQEYGPYVYVQGKSIRRYNRNTNLLSSACIDPECPGTCPLEFSIINSVNQVSDGKLFFYAMELMSHTARFGYQDIITGETTVLVTLPESENTMRSSTYVWEDWMYYSRKILRENGDSDNVEDYIDHICRVSVSNGNAETVLACDEPLRMVADGKIITASEGNVYSYDIKTLEKTCLFNLEELGYTNFASAFSYYNGKLYFLCRDTTFCTSEYKKSNHLYQFLLSADIYTGEVKKVVEAPVSAFTLTDNAIYYAPFELRHMYIPEDYEQHPENVVVFLASATLYACDTDGKNQRAVYTNEKTDYIEGFTVIDNTLYGWLYDFDDTNHMFGSAYFGQIDFKTGKIIPAEVEE